MTHCDVTVAFLQEYMRAKEEEWEAVRERMHREIKILRRQNTESLSLKIDAGESTGNNNILIITVIIHEAPGIRLIKPGQRRYKGN